MESPVSIKTPISSNMELRHLNLSHITQLSKILDFNDGWVKLLEKIPKDMNDIEHFENNNQRKIKCKYGLENIRIIREESVKSGRNPTAILLDEWSTSGIKRPTIKHLHDLLIQIPHYRAAEYVATNILGKPLPIRPPIGPAQRIDINIPNAEFDGEEIDELLDGLPYPGSRIDNKLSTISNMNNVNNIESNNSDPFQVSPKLNDLFNRSDETVRENPIAELNSSSNSMQSQLEGQLRDLISWGTSSLNVIDNQFNQNQNKTQSSDLIAFSLQSMIQFSTENHSKDALSEQNAIELPDFNAIAEHSENRLNLSISKFKLQNDINTIGEQTSNPISNSRLSDSKLDIQASGDSSEDEMSNGTSTMADLVLSDLRTSDEQSNQKQSNIENISIESQGSIIPDISMLMNLKK